MPGEAGQRKEAYDTYRRLATDYADEAGWFVPSLPKDADFLAELRRGEGCHSRAGWAVVMAPRNVPRPVGNLMQSFSAAAYVGKTVRLRARLRLETLFVAGFGVRFPEPDDRAQMWLNVERANRRTGFSDNMDDRPVRGNEWTMCEIVGDIGEDARFINFDVKSIGGRV